MSSRDPDKEYLSGCLMSGFSSLIILLVPIIICTMRGTGNHDINTNAGLTRMVVSGMIITIAFTVPFVRRYGIAPAFGSLGGYACGAAYWFLTLQQTVAKALAETGVPTEYQDSTMFAVPFAWLAIGAVASLLPLYKNNRINSRES
jgi:hypothetical protein